MSKLMYMAELIEFCQIGDKNILYTDFFDSPERLCLIGSDYGQGQ